MNKEHLRAQLLYVLMKLEHILETLEENNG